MTSPGRRLLLLGAGDAQLFVLEALARRQIQAEEVVLVSSHARRLSSGMVPGLVEGRYTIDQLSFDLTALARAAGATFLEDSVVRIDAQARTATLAGGRTLEYDVAAICVGGDSAGTAVPGVRNHALLVEPTDRAEGLVAAMETAAGAAGPEPLQVVVVGAGAMGIEMALTTRARLDRLGASRAIIALADFSNTLLRHAGAATSEAAERALRRGEVTLRLSTRVDEVGPAHVRVTGGRVIPADLIIWCMEEDAPPLFRNSGLPVEGRGYLIVDDRLAVPGAAGLFGAGDAVALQYAPRLPKSAGNAARQGPVLAHNLGIALGSAGRSGAGAGDPMGRSFRPSSRTLALLNTGDGRAIFSYSGLVATSAWAMALKDQIDRRFMRRFQRLYR